MSPEVEGKQAANQFRATHHLGIQPLGDIVTIIEETTGHDVAVLDTHPDEHGLTMHDPETGVVYIAVACTKNPMRQRSTLAHELGHVVFKDWHQSTETHTNKYAETRATTFARHLLVPEEALQKYLGQPPALSENQLSAVVHYFGVSPALAAIALHQCGYINEATKAQWMKITTVQLATRYGWLDHYRQLQSDAARTRAPNNSSHVLSPAM